MLKKLILQLTAFICMGWTQKSFSDDYPCTHFALAMGITPLPVFGEVSLESHCLRAYAVADTQGKTLYALDYMVSLGGSFVFGLGVGSVNFRKRVEAFSKTTGREEYAHSEYRAYGPVMRLDYFTQPKHGWFTRYTIVGGLHSVATDRTVTYEFNPEQAFDEAEQARLKNELAPKPGKDKYDFGLMVGWGFYL